MVKSCSAYGCVNRAKRGIPSSRVSFHGFPHTPKLRHQWVRALRRVNFTPTKWSSVCSDHFRRDDFEDGLEVKRLKSDAVPSVFKGFPAGKGSRGKKTRGKIFCHARSPTPPDLADKNTEERSKERPLSPNSSITTGIFVDCPSLFPDEEEPPGHLDSDLDPTLNPWASTNRIPNSGYNPCPPPPIPKLKPGEIPPLTHQERIARDHNYHCSPDIDLVRWKMFGLQTLIVKKVKKAECFKQQSHKLNKKNKELMASLQKAQEDKRKLKEATRGLSLPADRFSPQELMIVADLVQRREGKRKYCEEAKNFAKALHQCSPQAYQLVSSLFTLPCATTIRKMAVAPTTSEPLL